MFNLMNVSVLITHYNRPEALLKCLQGFELLNFKNFEIVVSDDCSEQSVQEFLKTIKVDKLILNEKNTGLASNLNRGLKACRGDFILYCQEDFIPQMELLYYIEEAIKIIKTDRADMCRLKANYTFPKLIPLTSKFKLIPKFSWKNFFYNTFQYSDNPFITRSDFFEDFGCFLDNVSGSYGENEYAIRIMKSKAKIAISTKHQFKANPDSQSVIMDGVQVKKRVLLKQLRLHRLLRAIRLHFEFLLYNPNKRRLLTMKNKRKTT